MVSTLKTVVILLAGIGIGLVLPETRAQTTDKERTVWYFYRVKWGKQQEFVDLFKKNHYPVLEQQMGDRLVDFKAYVPLHHGDGRADWTFATELVFKDDTQFMTPAPVDEITRRLYPDLQTFQEEERRRFEILDAHWDIPLTEVPME